MEEESLSLRAEAEDPLHVPLAEEPHSVTLTDQEICIQVSTCGPEPEPSNNKETQQVIEPPENSTEFELTNPEFDKLSIEIECTEIELDFDQEPMSVDLSCSETIPDETSPLPDDLDLNNLDPVVVEIEADNSSDPGHGNEQSSDVETNTCSSTILEPEEMDDEEVDTCSSPTSGLVPTRVLIEQIVLHSANSIDIPDPDMIIIQGESPALPGLTCSSPIVKEDTAVDPMDSTDAPALADVSVPVSIPEVLNSQIESSHVPAVSMELELETAAESEKPITKTTESVDKLEVSPLRALELVAESVKEEEDNDPEKPGPSTSSLPKTPKAKPAPSRTTRSAPMLRRRRRKRLMTRQRQTSAGSPNKQKPGSPQGKRLSRKDATAVKDDVSPKRIVRKRKAGSSKQEKNAERHEGNAERPAEIPNRTFLSTATLMYEGIKYRIGDIVQLTGDDGLIYYAHILRFLTDDYCEKFILIRWLVPREGVPSIKHYHSTEFNPLYFAPGPHQEEPISMRDIEFVMRAPRNLGPGKCEPTFNKCGELAVIFNTNIPENTGTSTARYKL